MPLSTHRKFSHIYIEEDAREHPDTRAILEKFPGATTIPINNYKEILNRSKQDWKLQKDAQKLILAKRSDEFLYPGSDIAPDFSHEHFYYNALTLNCIYNCHYCYLQGMYPSAHTVVFVNNEDYLKATDLKLKELGGMYLCLSYDTDLLAFEGIVPRASTWIEFAQHRPELIIEIRTKSVNISPLKNLEPIDNVIFAWTLSPQSYIDQHEGLTPSLEKRIEAMKTLAEQGWKVRACIDPILLLPDWEKQYQSLIETLFSKLHPSMIRDITIGTFRMPERYFKEASKIRLDSKLFYFPFRKEHGRVLYTEKEDELLKGTLKEYLLKKNYPESEIFVV